MLPVAGDMLGRMTGDGGGAPVEGPDWRTPVGRLWAWVLFVAICIAIVATFELVLYVVALILFSHMDAPACASTNTFCSPDGQRGLTGGAIVVIAGNITAVMLAGCVVLLFLRQRASGPQA